MLLNGVWGTEKVPTMMEPGFFGIRQGNKSSGMNAGSENLPGDPLISYLTITGKTRTGKSRGL